MGVYGSPEMLDFLHRPKPKEPVYCRKCGAVVAGKFCSECGEPVNKQRTLDRRAVFLKYGIIYFLTLLATATFICAVMAESQGGFSLKNYLISIVLVDIALSLGSLVGLFISAIKKRNKFLSQYWLMLSGIVFAVSFAGAIVF